MSAPASAKTPWSTPGPRSDPAPRWVPTATTKIVDRHTGEIFLGRVPPYSVVVSGSLGGGPDRPALYCAVIVKRVDARTRAKTSINDLLRD